jgi:hypothetical protein
MNGGLYQAGHLEQATLQFVKFFSEVDQRLLLFCYSRSQAEAPAPLPEPASDVIFRFFALRALENDFRLVEFY